MDQIDLFEDGHGGDIYMRYANRIFNCAAIGANQVRRATGGEMGRDRWVAILFEFLFFYVALTREQGLCEAGDERKGPVIERLSHLLMMGAVDFIFEDNSGDGNEELKTYYVQALASRLQEYAAFPHLLANEGEDKFKKTASGAFCARVSEAAGQPNDAACMMTCNSHIHDSLEVLSMNVFAGRVG